MLNSYNIILYSLLIKILKYRNLSKIVESEIMSISYKSDSKIFHLRTRTSSYVMQVLTSGHLAHYYWGNLIKSDYPDNTIVYGDRAFSPYLPAPNREMKSALDTTAFEYSTFGCGDFRMPAVQLQFADGSTVSDLCYVSHSIEQGKSALPGLPSVYIEKSEEADTLIVVMRDELKKIDVELKYSVMPEYDVITRCARIINGGKEPCDILKASSVTLDFPDSDYDMLRLSGSWARERHVVREALHSGLQSVSSARGASSHQQHPFLALVDKNADETMGNVYAFNLVYSGNFAAEAEVESDSKTRVSLGINSFDFRWRLEAGEDFQTPEAVMVFSNSGLGGMSRTYHKLYRERLCRGKYRDSDRYILINNWEATYFNFNEELIVSLAAEAKELGVEMFVLDDGWFGKRDSDNCSLGDWVADKNKLPDGIKSLAEKVVGLGLKFGLWFEPEMVSPDSDLYRAHPDWCIHVDGRSRTEGRNQLILDYSRKCVREYIVDILSKVLADAPISYIKWDMNRHMTEIGSAELSPERQRETAHRYILGLYEVLEKLTSRFPDILFESCSGGGGRFDPGMLYYMPQTWTSDNSDAGSRMKIQYGTSMIYPASAMCAHVSEVPNHQNHRLTSLETRGLVAMSGNFGYELDVRKMTDEDKAGVKEQIKLYREIRHTVLFGDQYRLKSPFEGNETAWVYVAPNKGEAVAFYFYSLAESNMRAKRLKLAGLDPDMNYRVKATGEIYAGDFLMQVGLLTPPMNEGDFKSAYWHLIAEK